MFKLHAVHNEHIFILFILIMEFRVLAVYKTFVANILFEKSQVAQENTASGSGISQISMNGSAASNHCQSCSSTLKSDCDHTTKSQQIDKNLLEQLVNKFMKGIKPALFTDALEVFLIDSVTSE